MQPVDQLDAPRDLLLNRVQRRLLQIISLLLLAAGTAFLIIAIISPGESGRPGLIGVQVVVNLGYLSAFVLAQRGYIRAGGLLLCILLCSLFWSSPTPADLLTRPIGTALLIPILIAGLLIGVRGVVLFATIVIASFGVISLRTGAPWTVETAQVTVLIVLISALLGMLIYTLKRSVDAAHQEAENVRAIRDELLTRESALQAQNDKLETAYSQQQQLLATIQDLETPVLSLANGILIVPLVGHIDQRRAQAITSRVLQAVHEQHAHGILVDISGISMIDTAIAQYLHQLLRTIQLLGSQVMITGISAQAALTMVTLGIDLTSVQTASQLQDGVQRMAEALNRRN